MKDSEPQNPTPGFYFNFHLDPVVICERSDSAFSGWNLKTGDRFNNGASSYNRFIPITDPVLHENARTIALRIITNRSAAFDETRSLRQFFLSVDSVLEAPDGKGK